MVREPAAFLEMHCGPFRLALRTRCILHVDQDVAIITPGVAGHGASIDVIEQNGKRLALVRFDDPLLHDADPPHEVPFTVTVETASAPIAIAADRVSYLYGPTIGRMAVPRFGIVRPELYEGAVRVESRLLLLLAPTGLAQLAAPVVATL